MALPTITVSSFTGWVKIVANQFKEDQLELYIEQFREQYLRRIVGAGAYRDIEQQTREKWDDLLNGVDYIDADGKRQYLNGLTDPLIYFIYFEYVRDNFTPTQPGKVKTYSENSKRNTDLEVLNIAISRHNQAVLQINGSLPCFLEANKKFEEVVTASTDNADNTYLIEIPNTKYLENGEPVTIAGTKYTVIDPVVADTSITIDAGATGLDFTNDSVIWEPYKEVDFCELQIAGI